MFDVPTKGDLDRKLSEIMHSAHRKAQAERARLESEFAAQSISSPHLISSIAECLDKIHAEYILRGMHIVHNFADMMNVPPMKITPWAKPQLENLGNTVLGQIRGAGFPEHQQRIRAQYVLVFQQRLESALRDIEIGFIRDRSMTIKDSDRRALVLQKFYDERHSNPFIPVPFDPSSPPEEQEITANICRQLEENGLIEWRSVLGTPMGSGRITSRGVDVIEGNTNSPIAITVDHRQFAIHNSSNVQIGEGNAQGITFSGQKIVAAINNSNASTAEKEKAKSAWQSVLDSSLLTKIIGYFTGEGQGTSPCERRHLQTHRQKRDVCKIPHHPSSADKTRWNWLADSSGSRQSTKKEFEQLV